MTIVDNLQQVFKKGGYPALLKALDKCGSESLSYIDIAKIINLSVNEVKTTEQVALRKLQHPRNSRKLQRYVKETITPEHASIYEDCSI